MLCCCNRKLRRQIVEKESAACAERHAAGSFKPIERSKLEANIKEFVRLSIRRLHASRPAAAHGQHSNAGGAPAAGHHGGVPVNGVGPTGAFMAARG